MSKELHVFTHTDVNYQQCFVFQVDRDKDNSIVLDDLFLITSGEFGDIKTKINIDDLIQSMLDTKGGNVNPEDNHKILEVFEDLITPENKQEILEDINYKDVKEISPDILIKISESIEFSDGSPKD